MNSLRQLLDQVTSGKGISHGLNDDEKYGVGFADRILNTFMEKAEIAKCFSLDGITLDDVDNAINKGKLTDLPEAIDLPYNVCWFEMEVISDEIDTYNRRAVLTVKDPEAEKNMRCYVFLKNEDKDWRFDFFMSLENIHSKTYTAIPHNELSEVNGNFILAIIKYSLLSMQCNNLELIENKPSKLRQQMRKSKKKKPLFSFWTLAINGKSTQTTESQGGTHATPRFHLRRGHVRQYAPGKFTWISEMAVSRKGEGMVHKDYKISPKIIESNDKPNLDDFNDDDIVPV